MSQGKFDPEIAVESTTRAVKDYAETSLRLDPEDSASEMFADVVMEFPGTKLDEQKAPLVRPLVHFEIDSLVVTPVGIGDNEFADNYDESLGTVNPQYASVIVVNFDVGIWTSARSGGTTMRMRIFQRLLNAFGGNAASEKFRTATDGGDGGIEIRDFGGGRFTSDTINDVPVFRSVNGELIVRCYSRTPISTQSAPAIQEIDQDPSLMVVTSTDSDGDPQYVLLG